MYANFVTDDADLVERMFRESLRTSARITVECPDGPYYRVFISSRDTAPLDAPTQTAADPQETSGTVQSAECLASDPRTDE